WFSLLINRGTGAPTSGPARTPSPSSTDRAGGRRPGPSSSWKTPFRLCACIGTMNCLGAGRPFGVPPSGGTDRLKPGHQTVGSWRGPRRDPRLHLRGLDLTQGNVLAPHARNEWGEIQSHSGPRPRLTWQFGLLLFVP